MYPILNISNVLCADEEKREAESGAVKYESGTLGIKRERPNDIEDNVDDDVVITGIRREKRRCVETAVIVLD